MPYCASRNKVRASPFPLTMKYVIIPFLILCYVSHSHGQGTTTVKESQRQSSNELGVRFEFNGQFGGQEDFMGLEFRHFGKKNVGYRLYTGYAHVSCNKYFPPPLVNDTLICRSVTASARIPMLGAGIEGQHPLYRYMFMFAAIECRFGYGRGTVDSNFILIRPDSTGPKYAPYSHVSLRGRGPANDVMNFGIATSFGTKMQLKKLTAGVEFPLVLSTSRAVGRAENDQMLLVGIVFFAHYRF